MTKLDYINRLLTFLFGGGLAGTVTVDVMGDIDMYLRWSVYLVTIVLGVVKVFLMIKKWRNK